jgi:hypothetical protein
MKEGQGRTQSLCGVTVKVLDLKGAVQVDHNKDMSVHVSIHTSYNFNILMPIIWKLWHL